MIISVRTKIMFLADPTILNSIYINLKKIQESTTIKHDVVSSATWQIRNSLLQF